MKTMRVLILGLLILAWTKTTPAQELSEPGWYQVSRFIQPEDDGSTNEIQMMSWGSGGEPMSLEGGASPIAEAITPEIQALARGLEYDPKRIFDFVHDNFRHVLYFGSKKGAQLTLLERSGNDFDQCALLVALLRASGYTDVSYQFGMLRIPYDRSDHQDLRHWLALNLTSTNTSSVYNYFYYLFGVRAIPYIVPFGDNIFAFPRVWVKLTLGSTNYYLDPAFKVSEPVDGIDLINATGMSSNAIWTAAGGTATATSVQNLSESALRIKLRDYTTNLVAILQSNYPNASPEDIMGGQRIEQTTNAVLSQSLTFPIYTHGGQFPVTDWDYLPTNLLTTLKLSFAGTNKQWFIPELQGRRLALTFSNSGVAELWLEDALVLQTATTGGGTISVTQTVNHPHGQWNTAGNTLVDLGWDDQTLPISFQRTNATYTLLYAFEPGVEWLRARQRRLDVYRQQGLADTSREVVSETLNVIGLNWLVQTELAERALATQLRALPEYHHRIGRMAQEGGRGYYIDVSMQVNGIVSSTGSENENLAQVSKCFQVGAHLQSALEHGIIEQFQSSNLVAASSIKMLQLANTNALNIYLTSSANWTTVRNSLINYDLNYLETNFINRQYTLLLPQDGSRSIAGAGSWSGYGLIAQGQTNGHMAMEISGNYQGGYVSLAGAVTDPAFVSGTGIVPWASPFLPMDPGADPVNMADGTFIVDETDLTLGQAEPKGISLMRHYSLARRGPNLAGMTAGWGHNYYFNLVETSSYSSLAQGTPVQMAPLMVATRAALEFYHPQPNPKNWAVTALIAKWGVDQLINNAVSISMGKDTILFAKQPDGSFTPPAKSTLSLLKTNGVYWLQQRQGNTFKFDGKGRLTNIVDQYSQSLNLTYLSATSNLPQTVTDWKNRTLTFSYSNSPPRLVSVSDNSGRTVAYGYTTNAGQLDLTSVTDPENNTHTFLYDTNHQIIAAKNALNQLITSNIYDGFGRVITQYAEGDPNKTWQLYWSGAVNVEQDPAGNKRRFHYDDKIRLVALEDALGNVSRAFYNGQDHVVMTVSPLNETNRFEFDGRHNLLRSIDSLGYTNQFFYDNQDRLVRAVDARNGTNSYGYNNQHSLIGQTNAVGDWITFGYNADGSLLGRTNAGGATTFGYDSNGQLNRITHPGGLGGEGFLNNTLGDVMSRTNGRGFVTSFQYNLRRELTNTIAPTNITARVAYDAVGNVQSTTDARAFTSSNIWSATQKLLATVLPTTPQGVPVITNVYDNRDWLTRTINPLQQATTLTNDAAQRLVSLTDPLNRTTRFGFDANGRKTATTNAANEVMRTSFNSRGEAFQSVDGANHTVLRAFDEAGNQVILTNRNGKKWQFQFDAANRLTNTITPLGRETRVAFDSRGLVSTVREPSTQTATNFYDAKGRLTNTVDAVASRLIRYDANNNVTNIVENGKTNAWVFDAYDRVSSYRDADGNLIQYRYDANGNLTNLIYPGNRVVIYAYDSLNRVTNVADWANRQTSIEYDLASRVKKISRPNGTVRTIDYDAAGQTTNIWEKTSIGDPIALFKFGWTNTGRMASEFTAPLPHAFTPPTRTMTFDDDNQLATFNGNNVTNDADGNLTFGPLTNNTFVTYGYDARNRLLNVGGLSYGYDPAGVRTAITNGSNVTRLVVNPNAALSQVLMRVKAGVTNYYIYGLGLLYEVTETATSTNTLAYHFDFRGSTVALTDSNGNVTDRIEYSPYAMTTYRSGTNDTPFLYNGRYGVQTDANGLLYMRARYYNPYLCRFINADPSGFEGGLNHYAYADGNPISLIDPFGLGAMAEGGGGSWITRAMGVGRALFGGVTAIFGYTFGTATAPTVAGAILGGTIATFGVDQFQAGMRQAWTGQDTQTMLNNSLRAAGMSPNAAAITEGGLNILATGGAGIYSISSSVNSVPSFATSGSTVTLYHQGNLRGGVVSGSHPLSTSTSPILSHYNPGATLNQFNVPQSTLNQWLGNGSALRFNDLHRASQIVSPEIRILPPASGQLNQFLVTPPP